MCPERTRNATRFQMFAVSQPGIEQLTAREVTNLGLDCRVVEGGVEFSGTIKELYLANLNLRTPNRVLVRLCRFRVTGFDQLIERLARHPWELYGIAPGLSNVPDFRVTCHKSRLYHTGAVAQRALLGIEKRVGKFFKLTEDGTTSAPLVIIRIVRDICTVSVDSSGEALHKRGYRVKGTRAPLRENLAAALIMLSGWKVELPLFDPFCGSGTIAIEAAMMASGIAPGAKRDFAFRQWKNFEGTLFQELQSRTSSTKDMECPKIYAADIDDKAVQAARLNAGAAGVEGHINFATAGFGTCTNPPCDTPGWIVTNPPYGRRIPGRTKGRRDVYTELSHAIQNRFRGWGITCLAPATKKTPLPGLVTRILATFMNSGFRVQAVDYRAGHAYVA